MRNKTPQLILEQLYIDLTINYRDPFTMADSDT